MKKFIKKALVCSTAAALAVGTCFSLAACGGSKPTKTYAVNPGSDGTVKYMTIPMKMINNTTETITLYDDNTYCFNVTSTIITGIGAITDNEGSLINRGTAIIDYYGTCSETVDSGVTLLTLSAPTRLTVTVTDATFTGGFPVGRFDTADWADANTEALNTWYQGFAKGEGDATGENILKYFAYEETAVAISETGMFDYIRASYFNKAMGALGF